MTELHKEPHKDLDQQYRTPANLNARIVLHQRFSTNPYGWFRWVFDQLQLPGECQVLELGCGPGDLWAENRDRIPEGWEILLTDASAGMIDQAEKRLQPVHPFQFMRLDAQSFPYPLMDQSYDAVIANHMLYHLQHRKKALGEIWRLLKPGGRLYATTVGSRHLVEIRNLLAHFDAALKDWGSVANPFTLDNGEQQIREWFSEVQQQRYPDGLMVTEAGPLIAYILSGWAEIPAEKVLRFSEMVEKELSDRRGVFAITKDSGIFIATR